MPFPDFWPKFTPKDKLGDWLEMYASALELNCWLSTKPSSLTYDDDKKQWAVKLSRTRDGKQETRELVPRTRLTLTGQVLSIPDLSCKLPVIQARRNFHLQ